MIAPESRIHSEILRIAVPSIVTNITVPLLGIVDVSIVGHLGSEAAIGAIAVGGLVFNMVYWLFNFLRMGSSGLTAQAYGRGDQQAIRQVLRMGLTVSLVCGLLIFTLQRPLEWAAQGIIAPSAEVWQLAVRYFRVRIWAAPAVLALFGMNGWLIGMQNSRFPLYIAVGQNIINIVASYYLVFSLGLGVEGVALGTVLSQYLGFGAALLLCHRQLKLSTYLSTKNVDNPTFTTCQQPFVDKSQQLGITYQQFFTVNADIFLRMICLIAVTTAFTAFGARMGDTLLAVNTLLMQLFTLFSYFSDGFALAGEALVGKRIGARVSTRPVVQALFVWGAGVTVLFTLCYAAGGQELLSLFTDDASVLAASRPYMAWVAAVPACGIAAFIWDGIYVGATATRQMFLSLLLGAVVFFAAHALLPLQPWLTDSNACLWLSFLLYLLIRSVYLTWRWPMTRQKAEK